MSVEELKEVRDLLAEQMLENLGVTFQIKQIDLATVDELRSRHNHGRVKPVQETIINEYIEAEQSGSRFPMYIVRFDRKSATYVILSGCHRFYKDMKLGKTAVMAYVVEVDDMTADAICWQANRLNGVRIDREEQIQLGVRMVRIHGKPASEVAEMLGVPHSTIQQAVQISKFKDVMVLEWNIKPALVEQLPFEALRKIAGMQRQPAVMKAVAMLAAERAMTTSEVKDLQTELAGKSTDVERLQWIESLKTTKKPSVVRERKHRTHLLRTLATIHKFAQRFPTRQSMQLTLEDTNDQALLKSLKKAEEELQRVRKLLA